MKNWLKLSALALCATAMTSCKDKEAPIEHTPLVEVCEVAGMAGSGEQTFTGKTKSASDVSLAFRVSGQIARVYVNEGDYVRRGQVIAEMDARDYQVQLAATQAEYEGIKAEAERVMALYDEGSTTQSNYDKARFGLQQITQKLANHRNQLADTKLRSTIDGYVATKLHESGETVSAGMPVVSVFGSGSTEVEIKISATDFANIERFTDFYCKFDVTGEEQFPMAIARKSQEANSNQLYAVRLRFTGPIDHKKITPGMSTIVYANSVAADGNNAINVPSSAVFEKNGSTNVFTYDSNTSTVHLTPVTISGLHRDGTTDIASGVQSGDVIVCSGVHHINDGQKVKLMPKTTESNVGGLL